MISALLGLLGAAIYGASDFFGGVAARGMSSVRVTAINSMAGFAVIGVGVLVLPTRWSGTALLTGAISGVFGALVLVVLYAALAIGPMSILAPILSLIAAVVPIAVGFARGERLSGAGYLGLAVGLVAVVLVCFVPGKDVVRPSARGVLLAVGAGLAVGGYLITIDLSPTDSGPAPLLICFLVTGSIVGGILLVQAARRREARPSARTRFTVLFAILCGLTDGVAAFLFLLALRAGDLSVVAVLNSLAPAGTIVLAALVLKERIATVQWIGLGVALLAAALLALA